MMPMNAGKHGVASPCISVCVMDEKTGWCTGCFRTIDEIAVWGMLEDDDKRAVLAELPGRRSSSGGGRHDER